MFLVAVDAYSKWPEVVEMSTRPAGVSAASLRTIEELRRIFSIHRLPQQIVSDNGPQFVSDQFAQFLKQNGIKHFRSSPYHPSSNGLTERFIQTLKKALKASKDEGTLQQRLASFLLSYRTFPHATTKEKACVLLMGRSLRDLLKPNHEKQVVDQQAHQKSNHDKHCKHQQFSEGDLILAKNCSLGLKWLISRCYSRSPRTIVISN